MDDPDQRVAERAGFDDLPAHFAATYDVVVQRVEELDVGTWRVMLEDGRNWVARVHPAVRPHELAVGDAEILAWLADQAFPAERLATGGPEASVSTLHGQAVVVTEWIPPLRREARREAVVAAGGLRALGELLARLQALEIDDAPPAVRRPGGAWHHLADGGPASELAAARHLALRGVLGEAVRACDDGEGLAAGFAHPDFVMANVVAAADDGLVLVDWSGAGIASRIWPLGFLLWSVGAGGDLARVDRVVAGYRRVADLGADELRRLEGTIVARPIVFEVWAHAVGRRTAMDAASQVADARQRAQAIAQRARAAFTA